jgi:hypothetical protein
MKTSPESADGTYSYAGKDFRVVKGDDEKWAVYDADSFLGHIIELPATPGSEAVYTLETKNDESPNDEPATHDWQSALELLIDNTAPPVGA